MMKENISQAEKKILDFWRSQKIFEKSVQQRQGNKPFVFYDGPPFATGRPHYGHLLPSTLKDTVLRYWTMQGYYIPRRVGWDCHGLPVENLAEKKLGIKEKPEIEEKGIDKFNQACRATVFQDLDIFTETLKRLGRWADYDHYYATLDSSYTESIWWIFKQLYDQGLIYKAYRVTPYCPRCGTPLSNFELNQPGAYREVEDTAVYFKVPLKKEPKTFLLVWTTTPWTIPANSAVAIQPQATYVKVKIGEEFFFLVKERLSILEGKNYEIVQEVKGEDLAGEEYLPLYKVAPYAEADYKILAVDWVSVEEGTGLVHLAPAFGEDDMKVGQEHHLSIKVTVDKQGRVKKGLDLPGAGEKVWKASSFVMQDLEKRRLLFIEEKIKHQYPFCWRCGTRLIYYPINSWYVSVSQFRKQLLANNEKTKWVPAYLKEGRFGHWLAGARDWSISRNRYWGAPLPVWQAGSEVKVIGSREELSQQKFSLNHYWLLRHAEAETNKADILSASEEKYSLTEKGRKTIQKLLPELKKKKIDFIFASPVQRTREVAEMVGQALKLKPVYTKELGERGLGDFEGKSLEDYRAAFATMEERMTKGPGGGETGNEVKLRIYNFLKKIDQEYQGKNILIISHQGPLRALLAADQGLTTKEVVANWKSLTFQLGELKAMELKLFPYNDLGELDFHRPFIDEIEFFSSQGEKMKRIDLVFDCWFESGAMPYAQNHYPFENKKLTEKNFPADFICEAVDQTRGWFYTLDVLAAALTLKNIGLGKNSPAFRHVIVPGLVLNASGQKLSKHLKNYPDPRELFEKYGADALRLFFLTSTALGNNYFVSEENVQQVWRKIILTLWHSYQFYKTYHLPQPILQPKIKNPLDRWIISRLHGVNKKIQGAMQEYQADEAARSLASFIDDLSNWYIRRSRPRLQGESSSAKQEASFVLGHVLKQLSLLIAPFAPFISERIYQEMIKEEKERQPQSVHLNDYPKLENDLIFPKLEEQMSQVRNIVSLGLRLRASQGLKVRQPLAELRIKGVKSFDQELLVLIQEELNIKKIIFVPEIKEQKGFSLYQEEGLALSLDTRITPALKAEGIIREISHALQMMRKDFGLTPVQSIRIYYQAGSMIAEDIEEGEKYFLEKNRALSLEKGNKNEVYSAQKEFQIDGETVWLAIKEVK